MRILIFNWRDLKNPKAGGAEMFTEEMAKRWVSWGHQVTLFTSAFPGALPKEKVEGVEIIRKGRQFTVHWHAYRYYKKYFQGKFDLVIDEINTIPFFTPFYVKEKKIVYINQLAREVWWYEAPFPISLFGYLFEPAYLKIYKKIPAITISESTRDDLLKLGFQKEKINIVYPGLYLEPVNDPLQIKKEKNPTILYFGSVRPMKRVDQIVESLVFVKKDIPNIRLWIAGGGQEKYIKKIENLIKKYKLEVNVKFWGRINEKQKKKLMCRAHIIAVTSIKEGWGIIVIEASTCGTPAVVYNIDGLRDSVINNKTGLICSRNNPQNLAENIIKLMKNKNLYNIMKRKSWERSKEFSWDKTAKESFRIIKEVYERK